MKLGAVLLAAGASRRFGRDNKLLAETGGKHLIARVAEVALESGLAEILVVTGHDSLRIEQALADLPLRFVYNGNWQSGMGTSIARGVAALGPELDGTFIIPCDMPFLPAWLLKRLVGEFKQSGAGSIVFPIVAAGEQRNPVLWPRRFFPALAKLPGAQGAKPLLEALREFQRPVTVDDASLFVDLDTQQELAEFRRLKSSP